ncbi:MAG: CRTAC1 family protein [Myxococcales bacterium]|nr:CRTAC1 family protein [Myxococcales bacterium]
MTRWVLTLAVAAALPLGSATAQLVDITSGSGLELPQHPFDTSTPCPELTGARCWSTRFSGGVAVDDVDADGALDIVMTRLGLPLALLRQDGSASLHFTDIAASVGLGDVVDANGALLVDVDRDGDLDLVLSFVGPGGHQLFRNEGSATSPTFVRDTAAGLLSSGVGESGFSIATGDVDRDGYPDLMFSEWRIDGRAGCEESGTRLYRNLGSEAPGRFEDVTRRVGAQLGTPRAAGALAFSPALEDVDGDGYVDLLVASDFGTSRLFWGAASGVFTDATRSAGVGLDETGMGSTLGDVDADGDLDWFVSAVAAPPFLNGNRLYRQEARRFTEVAAEYQVADAGWGWGAAFVDLDQDGQLDLVVANGASRGPSDPFLADTLRVYMQDAGAFTESAAALGVDDTLSGRGLVVADFDGDGDRDLLVANNGAGLRLYRNDVASGRWLAVRALSSGSPPGGRGARVYVSGAGLSRRVALIGTAGYFLGNGPPEAHFGLGALASGVVDVDVVFPSGARVTRRAVPVDQTLLVVEPTTVSRFVSLPAEPDCDANGQPDVCAPDCDENGVPDACDLRATGHGEDPDCNANGALDVCERAAGFEVSCLATAPEPPAPSPDAGLAPTAAPSCTAGQEAHPPLWLLVVGLALGRRAALGRRRRPEARA